MGDVETFLSFSVGRLDFVCGYGMDEMGEACNQLSRRVVSSSGGKYLELYRLRTDVNGSSVERSWDCFSLLVGLMSCAGCGW